MSDTRRVLIAGAGAVGGYIGAHLARAGHAVTLIDPWWENVAAIRARGLSITAITAEEAFTQPVRALGVGDAQSLVREAPFDYAFVAMKSYDTRWAAELVLPYLGPDGVIASAQNGINDPTIAAVAGPERTVGIVSGAAPSRGWRGRNRPTTRRRRPPSFRCSPSGCRRTRSWR
ncbi:ketopantoate reductase family protein [Azospirillum brasilense]|uniref:ketopantoate reductase family protein n=1 Tax=Azospirillum brasilense TaxID=192 RepID=UPI001FFFC6AF|nr:2-dehydropantoate 2-reductase [Azospirillum brasilense]